MKKLLLFAVFFFAVLTGFSQSYLGWTTRTVNFRTGPGTNFEVISSLKNETQIFIISPKSEDDYYHVIDIKTNNEGYIHKSFIKFGQVVKANEKGLFIESGSSSSYNPEIEIFNNTSLSLTLKLNDDKYIFSPQEKRKITLNTGSCNYRASAPGVIPNIGTEYLESNKEYSWQFYIVTKRRSIS